MKTVCEREERTLDSSRTPSIGMCVCVYNSAHNCMYVYAFLDSNVHTHRHIHTYRHAYVHTYVHTYIHTDIHAKMPSRASMHPSIHPPRQIDRHTMRVCIGLIWSLMCVRAPSIHKIRYSSQLVLCRVSLDEDTEDRRVAHATLKTHDPNTAHDSTRLNEQHITRSNKRSSATRNSLARHELVSVKAVARRARPARTMRETSDKSRTSASREQGKLEGML